MRDGMSICGEILKVATNFALTVSLFEKHQNKSINFKEDSVRNNDCLATLEVLFDSWITILVDHNTAIVKNWVCETLNVINDG